MGTEGAGRGTKCALPGASQFWDGTSDLAREALPRIQKDVLLKSSHPEPYPSKMLKSSRPERMSALGQQFMAEAGIHGLSSGDSTTRRRAAFIGSMRLSVCVQR